MNENQSNFIEPSNPLGNYDDFLRWRGVRNGVIRVSSDIEQYEAKLLNMEIDEVRRLGLKSLTIYINSNGGSVHDSLGIYDNLRNLSDGGTLITAIVEGEAASAAAMIILQAADKRCCRKNSMMLLHEIRRFSFFSSERGSELSDTAAHFKQLSDMVFGIMAVRCRHTIEEIENLVNRKEVWMTAEQALGWGLVDEVL